MYYRETINGYDIYEDFINADWVLFEKGNTTNEIIRGNMETVYNKATFIGKENGNVA